MWDQLRKLRRDLITYRETVDLIFSLPSSEPEVWRRAFFDILICASQLYLDYLIVMRDSSSFDKISFEDSRQDILQADIKREQELRKRLREALESCPPWNRFSPEHAFSNATGLRTSQDYINNFALHLPEIYEETFRVEGCVESFLASPDNSVLVDMIVGLQHMGRNHISLLQPALQWVTEEHLWDA
jgi:hypothetical protein